MDDSDEVRAQRSCVHETKHALEDESMDEVHDIDDALQVSIDTNASSSPSKSGARPLAARRIHTTDEDSDENQSSSDDVGLSDDSDSSSSEDQEAPTRRPSLSAPTPRNSHEYDAGGEDSDDEPPEIPGSPMAQMTGSAAFRPDVLPQQWQSPSAQPMANILKVHDTSNDYDDNMGDYEAKESEPSRTAEFHTSSSSDEDESDEDDEGGRVRPPPKWHSTSQQQRPKTAMSDLEKYRDVVPRDFFQQIDTDESSLATDESKFAPPLLQTGGNSFKVSSNGDSGGHDRTPRQKNGTKDPMYAFPVPQEVENLFRFISEYTPEDAEIPTRLEGFLPDYNPTVGVPFDGIQIPRPDGQPDHLGTKVLREPSGTSNIAELELLMHSQLRKQHNASRQSEFVHSIEHAAHRPSEIDQWIKSVANVQQAKPLAQVVYKHPMPSVQSLMELWPEDVEIFLSQQAAPLAQVQMDMNLQEFIKMVCVVLDIPVYEGDQIQSLHLLMSLYLEADAYERDQIARTTTD